MKIGIDLHGVAFSNPEFFSTLGKLFVNAGHEVHLITGSMWDESLNNKLINCDFVKNETYTHFFSIVDYHISIGDDVKFDKNGSPWMEENLWNETKAMYCKKENISLHFDDQQEYLDYFQSPYCLFVNKN